MQSAWFQSTWAGTDFAWIDMIAKCANIHGLTMLRGCHNFVVRNVTSYTGVNVNGIRDADGGIEVANVVANRNTVAPSGWTTASGVVTEFYDMSSGGGLASVYPGAGPITGPASYTELLYPRAGWASRGAGAFVQALAAQAALL